MEALEKTKTLVGEWWNRILHGAPAPGYRDPSETACPVEPKDAEMGWSYRGRAKMVLDGRADEIRYKVLTLGQLDISRRRQLVGKDGEQRWNDGERVLAFEDGTLAFKESGSEYWGPLDHMGDLACWIGLLDSFPERWEAGPSSKIRSKQIH